MQHPVKMPKKLIEVAIPLDAINTEASLRKRKAPAGYPTTLHKWWAQRPVAAARAVIFGQLVNDPSWKWEMEHPGAIPPNNLKASWAASRKRLFGILEDLVKWENTKNDDVMEKARAEIRKSWRETCELNKDHEQAAELFNADELPALEDPFAGAGSIPMEAQRLGLEAFASDLNPVAVLINKATIEIPPKFAGKTPVNPEVKAKKELLDREWKGAQGLAEDVRYYGRWMRGEAEKRIGHLYPKVEVTADVVKDRPDLKPLVGQKLTVVAWIWVRTVKSSNPAFRHIDVPLASTFILCNKPGREVYVQPVVERDSYRFTVKHGTPPAEATHGTKMGRGANFRCVLSNSPIEDSYIKSESLAGRMGVALMAIVTDGPRGRFYLPPTSDQEAIAKQAVPSWKPDQPMNRDTSDLVSGRGYGFLSWADLFTMRQLTTLATLCDLIVEARQKVLDDARSGSSIEDNVGLESDGLGHTAYSEAISVYLALVMSRVLHYGSTICTWLPKDSAIARTFTKQAIPMSWDFSEGNVFGDSSSG